MPLDEAVKITNWKLSMQSAVNHCQPINWRAFLLSYSHPRAADFTRSNRRHQQVLSTPGISTKYYPILFRASGPFGGRSQTQQLDSVLLFRRSVGADDDKRWETADSGVIFY